MTGEDTSSGEEMNGVERPTGADASVPAVEVALERASTSSKTPWGAIAGAGALVLALGAGALVLTNGDSELDTAEAQAETVDEGADSDGSGSADGEAVDGAIADTPASPATERETAALFDSEEAMEDSSFFGGPTTSTVVFDGERFVSLSSDGDSWMLRSSVDGLEWTEVPTTGLANDGFIYQLHFDDGTLVAVLESYDEGAGRTNTVVSSTDGLTWTGADLPSSGENGEEGISGFAIAEGRVVMVQTVYDLGPDPVRLIVDAGILTESQYETFCGFGGFEEDNLVGNGPIEVLVCNFDEGSFVEPSQSDIDELAARYDAATTDEERNAIEREVEELWGGGSTEVVATIEPGDPLYAEIVEVWFGEGDIQSEMTTSVLAGPVTGPFSVVAELPSAGYYNGIVEAGGALFVSAETFDDVRGTSSTRVLTSADGTAWAEAGTLPAGVSGQVQSVGDALVLSGYDSQRGALVTFVSTDGAVTWTESTLDTGLFEAYTMYSNGQAGSVALTTGLLEPWEDFEVAPPEFDFITLTSNGYSLEVPWDSGAFSLTGPDGTVIYELGEEELWGGDNPNVRQNPISGSLTFLDPDTGEVLVSFSDQDWEEAYEVIDSPAFEGEFEEPEQGFQLHFSADGLTWTELDTAPFGDLAPNAGVSIVAVGDDEAVFSVNTWTEPAEDLFAFEVEGRDPSPEELDAISLWEGGAESIEYVRVPLS